MVKNATVKKFLAGEVGLDEDPHEQDVTEQEEPDIEEIVNDLIETDFSDNEDQGKFAELIEGLAFSDNEMATAFIAELQDLTDEAAEEAGIDVN